MDHSKHITQAIAGALEIMNEQPLSLNEFIDEVMRRLYGAGAGNLCSVG